MRTRVDQISDRIYRISTCIPEVAPGGFTFNQFLVDAEEPLLYHTGMRQLFPLVKEAIERIMPVQRLRWISFAHVEADECGAVNNFLEVAPHAQVVHGEIGCQVSLNDLCDRVPRPLADGEIFDIGGATLQRRLVALSTPHVPHNWESHMLFERETRTLLLGDLCTQMGDGPAVTDEDPLEAMIAAEDLFHQTSLGPAVPVTYRRLADLEPLTLAVMHGSSYTGDCARLLRAAAEVYQERYGCGTALPGTPLPEHQQLVGSE
jgi:flavorubredoxin